MTGYLKDNMGKVYRLPPLVSWQMLYTDGKDGTDAFEICFPYIDGIGEIMDGLCGFFAEHEKERVFTGIVDEYKIGFTQNGNTVSVSGRGMGGVLLDNACRARQYLTAGLDDVLSAYVYPYGITVSEKIPMDTITNYSVSQGSSAMSALSVFTEFSAGVTPRFSKTGSLILNNASKRMLSFSPEAGMEMNVSGVRHDVFSTVTVIRSDGKEYRAENDAFIRDGGKAERYVSVPKTTGYDAMHFSAKYRIDKSMQKRKTMTVKTAKLFAAEPCDSVVIPSGPFRGNYSVASVICFADADGSGSRIVLREMGE